MCFRNGAQPKLKELLVNPLVNSGGLGLSIMGTVLNSEMYLLSEFSDEHFLDAIHQIRVGIFNDFNCNF